MINVGIDIKKVSSVVIFASVGGIAAFFKCSHVSGPDGAAHMVRGVGVLLPDEGDVGSVWERYGEIGGHRGSKGGNNFLEVGGGPNFAAQGGRKSSALVVCNELCP